MTTLDTLRKSAKRWLKALRDGDPAARARLARAWPEAPERPTLRDVQHALARERGHQSWIALTRASEATPADAPLTALLTAANSGDAARVAAILDEHPDLVDERGTLRGHTGLRTALHFGVAHEPVVRTLLERGANPNVRDEGDNACPIHFAAERGDLGVVTLLVEHGADPVAAGTTHGLDALGWAVCFENIRHLDVAEYLLAHGARHTLLSAVAMGDVIALRELAAAGADLDQRMDGTNKRRTPLHLAIIKKQPAALAALIELGADLNLQDAVGLTPIDQAALDGEDTMAAQLLDAGARVTAPAAIALDRSNDIDRIVREDPELLSTTNNRGWARLVVHASGRASGAVLDRLLRTIMRHRSGLSIVNMEDDRETAVDGASRYTPLHAAAFHGNAEAVDILLAHGADPRVRDGKYCATPAGWARYAGHTAVADRILDADVDIFDAVDFDRADRVRDILDRDPDASDRPFKAYASCPQQREAQWWPEPDATPVEWAKARGRTNALRVLEERGARTAQESERAGLVVSFLQSACWDHHVHGKADHRMHDRAAQRLLAEHPWIASETLHTAIVCGEREEAARMLDTRPDAVRVRGGARGWTPLLYLAYTRFTHDATIEHAVDIARLLLDRGADPNDFYMAGDSRYTVLTGVAGEGEQDSPRQPYAAELFQLLLERGADPFDIQILYNTHFSGDMLWWLDLVHRHTVDGARRTAWSDPEWRMFDMGGYGSGARFVLETAIKKRKVDLAEWALARGANPNAAPARDRRFPRHSLYEFAVLEGCDEIAELLAEHGAQRSTPTLGDEERFIQACMRKDDDEVRRLLSAHPEYLQSPAAMFAAARRNRPDVLAFLLDLGFSVEVQDRTGMRALHEAAVHNAVRAAAFLIERGAEIDPRESTYGGTPLGWASHGDHEEVIALLARHSRDVRTLAFRGFVDRLRAVLAEDPAAARVSSHDGWTPLFWLPDDEARAMEIVELLLGAGVDPAAADSSGRTAADMARRRGMLAVAERLDRAAASARTS